MQGCPLIIQNISTPPLLSKPQPGGCLFLYLSISANFFNAVLDREEEGRQHAVYYVSKVMADAEKSYP